MINSEIDQKELLFQTIFDMANNLEIQKVILDSEITGKRFFDTGVRFSVFTPPVLTEKILKHAYTMGVILSKTISKSKIQTMLKQYQVSNLGKQKDISNAIERDVKLKGELTQLSELKCDCENENTTRLWNFPIFCALLQYLAVFIFIIDYRTGWGDYALGIILNIASTLNCFWY